MKNTISALIAAGAVVFGANAAAAPVTIDFDDLSGGDVIADQYASFVMFSSLPGTNGFGDVMVFDTLNVTGGDTDLGVPIRHFMTGEQKAFGNVAIISEDNDSTDPDDNRFGGSIVMDFVQAVTFLGFDAIDINAAETITLELFNTAGDILNTITNDTMVAADNEFFFMDAGATEGVTRAIIRFTGSGAVDNISFDVAGSPAPIPVPGAVWLMVAGLGGLGVASRRRKAA